MATSIWCYLWDLLERGLEPTLREIWDLGLDGISLATAYHSVEHWRIQSPRSFVFRERDASLYFRPQWSLYGGTRLRPKVSPLADAVNPLEQISVRCEVQGLALNSWTVGTHNSYLCAQWPDCAERNVFGDLSATALCPANPEVRRYLCSLLRDLTSNYRINRVELESFTFEAYPHSHQHEKIGIPFGETDRFLLGICFCASCQQRALRAGVNVNAAIRFVGDTLVRVFATGESTRAGLEEFVAGAVPLQPYLTTRQWTVSSLMAELRQVCKAELVFMHFANPWVGGYKLKDLAPFLDGILLLCYQNPQDTEKAIRAVRQELGGGAKVIAGFHAYAPATPTAVALREQVATARRLGVYDLNFYNYGIMPRRNLQWIDAAIR